MFFLVICCAFGAFLQCLAICPICCIRGSQAMFHSHFDEGSFSSGFAFRLTLRIKIVFIVMVGSIAIPTEVCYLHIQQTAHQDLFHILWGDLVFFRNGRNGIFITAIFILS